MSNTEGLVMIPLALHTARKKDGRNREKGRQGERMRMTERKREQQRPEKPKTRKGFAENMGR